MANIKKETLCWECYWATGGCSWADEFKPVEGWTAIPTELTGEDYTSYCVTSCPKFKADDRRFIKVAELAKIFDISERQFYRLMKESPELVKAQLKRKGYNLIIIDNEGKRNYYVRKEV